MADLEKKGATLAPPQWVTGCEKDLMWYRYDSKPPPTGVGEEVFWIHENSTFVYVNELRTHIGLTGLMVLLGRVAWAAVTCPFQGPLKGSAPQNRRPLPHP